MNIFDQLNKKLNGRVEANVLLKDYTTFKIGGPAKYFYVAKTKEDVINAVAITKELQLPLFVLGGGSNVLISDEGFNGLVIKIELNYIKIEGDIVIAGSGLPLPTLVNAASENNLSGFEWAAGIPGATVGGAIVGNAGAFGGDMASMTESVVVLKNSKELQLRGDECGFGYRQSIFKNNQDIILEARLKFKPSEKKQIKQTIDECLKRRRQAQDYNGGSVGSIFKNTEVAKDDANLFIKYSELQPFANSGKIPAGKLIEMCELKGKQIGGAQISEKHANFIINTGNATAEDVIMLISFIKQQVRMKFGVQLREEMRLVGF